MKTGLRHSFRNVAVVGKKEPTHFNIQQGRLTTQPFPASGDDCQLLAFPGLTNAHDHLEFNNFPLLGRRHYRDYKEWGTDIHQHFSEEINHILKIPVELRIGWGIVKNLLNGVTCVVHHGGYHDFIKQTGYPVVLRYQYLHSIGLDKRWKMKLNLPWFHKDLMIHIGEGVTVEISKEIDDLIEWNWMRRKLIGIHAIPITADQARHFKAIVWCPDSNLFLYGKSPQIDKIREQTTVLFGTDSAVSASSNLWEQLRIARSLGMLSDEELFDAMTVNSQKAFHLTPADSSGNWVIARRKHQDIWESFYNLNPEDILLVSIKNEIVLADAIYEDCIAKDQFRAIQVNSTTKRLPTQWAEVINQLEKAGISIPLNIASIYPPITP
jgi:hypothetical protein